MRSNAWQQRVMDVEFIFAARKSLWHRLSADSSSPKVGRTERYGANWGVPGNQSL